MKTHLKLLPLSTALLLGAAALVAPAVAMADFGVSARVASTLPKNATPADAVNAILQATKDNPDSVPSTTAAVIVAQPGTIAHAGEIAGGVVNAKPDYQASRIAAAIANNYATCPALVKQARPIAVCMVQAILLKGEKYYSQGEFYKCRIEIAETVAALVSMLPGSVAANHDTIMSVANGVAPLLSSHPDIALSTVGIASTAMKAAAGDVNIQPTLDEFADVLMGGTLTPGRDGKNVVAKTVAPLENPDKDVMMREIESGKNINWLPASPYTFFQNAGTGAPSIANSNGGLITYPRGPGTIVPEITPVTPP